MDVLNNQNIFFLCKDCQMYINLDLLQIHNESCSKQEQHKIKKIRNEPIFECNQQAQEHNLFDKSNFSDFLIGIDEVRMIQNNIFLKDNNYIERLLSTILSQESHHRLQQTNYQLDFKLFNDDNFTKSKSEMQQKYSNKKQFTLDSTLITTEQSLNKQYQNNNYRNQFIGYTFLNEKTTQIRQTILSSIKPTCFSNDALKINQFSNYHIKLQESNQQQQNNIFKIIENYEEISQCKNCFDYIKYSDYSTHLEECAKQNMYYNFFNEYFPINHKCQHLIFCEFEKKKISSQLRSFNIQNQIQSSLMPKLISLNFQINDHDESKHDDFETPQNQDPFNQEDQGIISRKQKNNIQKLAIIQQNQSEAPQQQSVLSSTIPLEQETTQQLVLQQQLETQQETQQQQIIQEELTIPPIQQQSSTQQLTVDSSNIQENIQNINNSDNEQQNNIENNEWSPEFVQSALNLLFPSFQGEQDEFRRQQNELYRNNLIRRIINIQRYGISGENNMGLSTEQQDKFIKVKYIIKQQTEYKSCSICMCDFEENEEINILDCMHRYHVECISKWFETRTTCPICKKDMTEYMV